MSADFFDRVELELTAAATRRVKRRSRRRFGRLGGPFALAGAIVLAGGGALAATGHLNLGSPEPEVRHTATGAARGIGVPPSGRGRLLGVRAPDGQGGPPLGIRTFQSTRGYDCAQIGHVVDGRLVNRGSDGKWHEQALHCMVQASPGGFGSEGTGSSTLIHGFPGSRARVVTLNFKDRPPVRTPARDGAFLVRIEPRLGLDDFPRIDVTLDDGSHWSLGGNTPIPGTMPPKRTLPPPIAAVPIRVDATTIGAHDSMSIAFKAPFAVTNGRESYRLEINGPHRPGCAGRSVWGSMRNYAVGDTVRMRLGNGTRPLCTGKWRGRVSFNIERTVGTFRLRVRSGH